MKAVRKKRPTRATRSRAGKAPPVAAARQRVLIVEDHPVTRMGLTALINGQTDLVVCGEAADSATALGLLRGCRADLIVVDLFMPGRSGVELIKDLRSQDPKIKILVLSMQEESFYGLRVLHAGARGYVMKSAGGDCVLAAMRQVLAGGSFVSSALSDQIIDDLGERPAGHSQTRVDQLTDREFEVFRLIGQGNDTHAMSDQLHLSPRTVDVHRANIRKKLGLPHSTALVQYAARWSESDSTGRSAPVEKS